MSAHAFVALAALVARRVFERGTLVLMLALAVLLVARAEPSADAHAASELHAAPAVAAGLARQACWIALLLSGSAVLAFSAARSAHAWCGPEAGWVLARRARGGALAAAALCGFALALLPLLAACFGSAELAAARAQSSSPANGTAWQQLRELPGPQALLLAGDAPLRWTIEDPRARIPERARIRLCASAGPGAPSTACELSARRAGAQTSTRARVHGRSWIELDVPPGAGALELVFQREAGASWIALGARTSALLAPIGSARAGSWRVAAHAGVALLALAALAFACGTRMNAGLALALCASVALPACFGERGWQWLPGAPLSDALAQLGQGVAPAWPGAAQCAQAAALVLAAALAAAAALRRGALAA
jgi:hypothetical protein